MTDDTIAQDTLPESPASLVPEETVGRVEDELDSIRVAVSDLEQQARTLIRQQPVVSVLAAAGLGYLVARLLARNSG